jgi:flagellar basal body-associated protein FliL
VVNLADAEDNRFLRVGVDLGLAHPVTAKDSAIFGARIRDCIIADLSKWSSDALLAPGGKQKLKNDLAASLQERVPEIGVQEVYFTDFLVQR